ncbi:glycoside hydrolase family 3 N-terminal domain-containing protein [Lactococcus protaetiae]|uniref:beta-N-acetylhexosaminidase n=1 Tax=Lactococcus protaetiae TaxID=2592653 RepID=A0A514Z7X3_9LACT|nr:glycoside hydrolase family 3 N-terminal domain-containing protein [Lactococcus protaetiae]QDK70675.1 glycoside hydrolase family 3 protein [Lactococcus protaetiae]
MKKRKQKRNKKRLFIGGGFAFLIVIAGLLGLILKLKPHPENSRTQTSSMDKPLISSSSSSTKADDTTRSKLDLTLEEEIGQLIMTGMPANNYSQATLNAISDYHIGSVILTGRSYLDISSMKEITETLQNLAPKNLKLLISCDQEGGNVQVLQGKGFTAIPDGLTQGGWAPGVLEKSAQVWGSELIQAGVNFDLAPVADSVPSAAFAPHNAPIGYWHREYGYGTDTIVSHTGAFYKGMKAAKVLTTAKHFPGLGNVTGNTDTTSNVTDTQTSADSASVMVFKRLIDEGIPSIMTATAIYTKIDPTLPGAFSPKMVQGLLRDKLGFDGLVITDDLSNAIQVQAWTPEERAVLALNAGNDMILVGDATQIPEIVSAILAKAKENPDFANKIHQAATRVVKIKQQMKLAE